MSAASTEGMTLEEARRYLKSRTEVVFDAKSRRGGVGWSVADAHAARLVLFELDRRIRMDSDLHETLRLGRARA